MEKCFCCKKTASLSVLLVNADGRIYIPNQNAREFTPDIIEEIWFCRSCMRLIEDGLRKTISEIQAIRDD